VLDKLRTNVRRARLAASAISASGLVGAMRPTRFASFVAQIAGKPRNPSNILKLHALNTPDKPAIVEGDRRVTWAELEQRVNRLATALAARGVRPGSRVALMMRNCIEFIEIQWATTRLGALSVQIGYRLKPPEVAYILGNAEPAILFCQPVDEAVAREARAAAGKPADDALIVLGPAYEALLATGHPTEPPPAAGRKEESSGGVVIYTSGTTGRPKGASRDFKIAMHESVSDFLRQIKVRHDDRHLCVCPLYHSAAPAFVAFVFGVGGTVYLMEHFEPEAALELIAREKITSSFMVPTMMARLAAAAAGHDTSSLRFLAAGAAPLPTETARRVEAAFGPILYNFYGATETGLVTLALPGEHTARPGTIGRVLAGNQLRLLDEQGREVGPGEVGELYVRNSMLVNGYHRDRAATDKAMRDGFFSVGDMARIDADGFVYLADRKHDMVISGGVNIYPLEIEQRLHEHPGVLEVAVVGIPDPEWGEALKAFVVRRPGAEVGADELRDFCKLALANFKCPRQYAFLDALPRNPTGKVLKRELRALVT
jgi:fatty-acyl-CoA synthase